MVPTLSDVGAVGRLANGMQIKVAGQLFEIMVIFPNGSAGLEPVGFRDGTLGREVDLDQIRLDWVWGGGHEILILAGKSNGVFQLLQLLRFVNLWQLKRQGLWVPFVPRLPARGTYQSL